jgi:dipeptidyl aminopeptidase/acylaminoacyl peptidase
MMRIVGCAAIAATAILFATPIYAAPPSAEMFGALPQAQYARLSPDGKRLAVIKPVDGREKVVFYDLTKPDSTPYTLGMDGGLAGEVIWKTNDRALCIFHANLRHLRHKKDVESYSRMLSVDVPNQSAVLMLYNFFYLKGNPDGSRIVDIAPDDPDHVYMAAWNKWDHEIALDLFKVDVKTGGADLALHGNYSTIDFLTDGHGHPLGHIEQNSDLTDHVFLGSKEVYQYPVKGRADFEIEGPLGGATPQFAVERPTASGTTGLYSWTAGGSGSGTALFEDAAHDLETVLEDDRSRQIIGVAYTDDQLKVLYFDPARQHVQELLEKAYPGQSVQIVSKDDADASYVIRTEGPRNPPVLSLYTTADHKSNIVQEAYPSLKPSDLGEMKPYPYKARDGLDIHAYLTLPPGKDPHNLPTVIFPHGGPEARDALGFDWWAQFMASRGYAVLQPNYRGSAGYGWDFVKAGDGQWASKAQYDVQDGVKKLIADGIADPKRICIVGASWGGYMALAGATFSPDIYACAVSYAGVSDLKHAIYTGTTFESEGVSIWKRRLGSEDDSGKSDAQSPANFADRVKIPVLLLHSDKDTTVDIDQSEIEERALKRAGKQVEFVRLPGDDHYLEFADTRTKMLKEVERFLAAHIGS